MTAPITRFKFLADALDGIGGFAPAVSYSTDANGSMSKPREVVGPCYLIPYPRESALKFAGRAALATYENHLRSACERFVGYIAKRSPMRDGLENPLLMKIAEDADWAGNHIDVFWQSFMVDAKARGSMLLLVDMPAQQAGNMAEAIARRLVPYLTPIAPERVTGYALDERKRFKWIKYSSTAELDGKQENVDRYWDAEEWRVYQGEKIIDRGPHSFSECPVLIFTESGEFPHVGNFAQIADLSRRLFNARSELDEILRSQTFSLLTYQIPPERASAFSAEQVSATIGTHNMLVHEGDTPAFIAPPDGPATVYQSVINALQESIAKIGHSVDSQKDASAQESGLALAIRFQALNGALSSFAQRMQDLESRLWALIGTSMGLQQTVTVQWATDYSLADTERELSILTAMMATGFADAALIAQRKRIAGEAFNSMDDEELAGIMSALDESVQEIAPAGMDAVDAEDTAAYAETEAPQPQAAPAVDLAPLSAAVQALSDKVDAIPVLVAPEPVVPPPTDLAPVMDAIAALSSKVDAIETAAAAATPAAPAPQAPIIFNTAQGAKVIDLVRDADGNLTGANVREA